MRRALRLLVPALAVAAGGTAVALTGGCGASAPPKETTVRGRVTFQGRPVGGATVVFAPDAERGTTGKPLRATAADDGTFTLRAGDYPVPAGWYRVALAAPPDTPTDPPFPPDLRRPDRSGVVREVATGKDHVFEFAVEAPGPGDAARPAP